MTKTSPLKLAPSKLAPWLVASCVVALGGCGQKAAPQMPPTEVGYVTLQPANVPITDELTGRASSFAEADVRPQADGVILKRLFVEGSMVKAGQPLYQIDPRLYKATLGTSQAQLDSAQANYVTAHAKAERYRTLRGNQAVSKQDIDDAIAAEGADRALIHQYQASIQTAKVNLEYTRVLAPISGRIGRSSVTEGALVSAAQTTALATIQQLDPIYVDVTESASNLVRLRQALAKGHVMPASTTAHLTMEDGTDYPLDGRIEFSEVTVDESAGTVTMRARFPNPDGLLMPGMFVRVTTPQGVVPNGILAPQQGISRDANGDATALVVGAGNKVEERAVKVARTVGNTWLVISGLKAGDKLIVEGTAKVKPGMAVKPVATKLGD